MSNTITKNRKKTLTIVIALIAVMLIGGVSAYFTSTDQTTNTWTVGKIKIDLQEPEYDKYNPTEADRMLPNAEIHKDPQIQNLGNNDAYVFLKVSIPKQNVIVADQDGTRQTSAMQELFDYQWNTNWTVVTSDTSDANYNTYVVAYAKDGVCTALAPAATTTVLFKNAAGAHIDTPDQAGIITFKNVIEGQGLEEKVLDIHVEAYGIQTTDLGLDNVSTPSEVWAILSTQTNTDTVSDLTDYVKF